MELYSILSYIVELGIIPAMLLVFVLLFVKRDKRLDEQSKDLLATFKERTDALLADGMRREDIMRSEAAKREQLMREEAQRRDAAVARSLDGINSTMEKMSGCFEETRKALVQMDFRLQNIEGKMK